MENKTFFLHNNTLEKLPDWLHDNKTTPDITININCTGGDVLYAIESINLMKAHKGQITTTITGCAESSALLIAMSGHKRYAYSNAWGMTHPFSTNIEGTYYDHLDAQKHNKILHATLINIIQEKTHLPPKIISKQLLGRKNTWLTPLELLKLNIIDAVIQL